MINNLLLVGVGGAAGSMLRYLLQRAWNLPQFPFGTLAINVAGCLLIGIGWGWTSRNLLNEPARLLLLTGFCGGFTTFSAFTLESIHLLKENRWLLFSIYTGLSVVLGIVATFVGYKISFKL